MSHPYLLVPQSPYSQSHAQTFQTLSPFRSLQPSFLPHQLSPNNASIASTSANPGSSGQSTTFKAPAHKHAHHLHSIPPREKSTRTLIIDHLLWVHCRTRFAQARAELGMSDRTGGSSSPNYIHRERPENYDEEDEAFSEGEDDSVLRARSAWSTDAEEEKMSAQDLQLAKNLRTRSESVEKVVDSMLSQPPAIHPIHPDDLIDPPSSPKSSIRGTNSHPHTLPNGVRLRIVLATLINDFFARQSPLPPHPLSVSYLPPGIVQLLPISPHSPYAESNSQASYAHMRPHVQLSARARSLYAAGVDLLLSSTPRCSRHLNPVCTVCTSSQGRPQLTGRLGGGLSGDAGVTGWQDGSGIGSGLAKPGIHGNLLQREVGESTNMVELLIRFLRLSALVAMELGNEAIDERSSADGNSSQFNDQLPRSATPFQGKMRSNGSVFSESPSPTSQRFSRDLPRQTERERMQAYTLRPSREWYTICAGLITRAVLEGYMMRGWTGLCALETLMKLGMGLRPSVMEMDMKTVETQNGASTQDKGPFEEFDPDDFPTLLESAKVLFPSLRYSPETAPKEAEEEEYELEMEDRLARFYDISSTTPDLSTHLEDLSWQHPAEPLERAALRFFEAIAKWRGKPELETYKKKPNQNQNMELSDIGGALSIDSLVNSSPGVSTLSIGSSSSARRPGIEKYFLLPTQPVSTGTLGYGGMLPKRRGESLLIDPSSRMQQGQGIVGGNISGLM